jgi:hypothetical protein
VTNKRFDLDDLPADMSLNERIGYGSFGRKMRALRSRPLMAIATVVLALAIVGWLIVLNHSYDLGRGTHARTDAAEHNPNHHLPP